MELTHHLQQILSDLEEDCLKEVEQLCSASLGKQYFAFSVEEVWMNFAIKAVLEIVCMLQSFNPEISKERLSSDVHSIVHSEVVVGGLRQQTQAALRNCVPFDRRKWLRNDIERHLARRRVLQGSLWRKVSFSLRWQLSLFIKDGKLQTTAAVAAGGAVVGSTGGGVFGLLTGSTFGAVCGLVPALMTFGLSVPVGAFVGGGAGMVTGAATGGTMGLCAGGLIGRSAYARRSVICSGASQAWKKANVFAGTVKDRANCSATYVKGCLVGGGTGGTA
eukprot:TRINITY_DN91774_c0_g1_i1.p1 TRINITY_DN91774_c0_g1~~TRINITY_DN91774_c0_g1_i1.p1  ORF type:complete len:290 (-),score=54.15 TRINITY_DN91774_c0_g1_i1:165-992(-)